MASLLFKLEGPMQSWGTRSRFTIRETGMEPSKSGVVGLVCAALGKPRKEVPGDGWPPLEDLARLGFAVRVDRPGRIERDYQTAGGSRLGDDYGVIRADESGLTPVVSHRFYLADASFLVGFEGDGALLERIAKALWQPRWPLYLGRKSYLPSRPLPLGDGLGDEPLLRRLETYPWFARSEREEKRIRESWQTGRPLELEMVADATLVRGRSGASRGETAQDVPIDFAARRFGVREIARYSIALRPEMVRRDPLCISLV